MLALVLGSAACVDADAAAALELCDPDSVFAVNDMIARWHGPVDYAVTLHPEKLPRWMADRVRRQKHRPQIWCHSGALKRGKLPIAPDHTTDDWQGSSGLFAVKVARLQGFDRIVLAGMPMDARPHVPGISSKGWQGRAWPAANAYRPGWIKHQKELAPFVRSMSGWTAELFGKPDGSWLAGSPPAGSGLV